MRAARMPMCRAACPWTVLDRAFGGPPGPPIGRCGERSAPHDASRARGGAPTLRVRRVGSGRCHPAAMCRALLSVIHNRAASRISRPYNRLACLQHCSHLQQCTADNTRPRPQLEHGTRSAKLLRSVPALHLPWRSSSPAAVVASMEAAMRPPRSRMMMADCHGSVKRGSEGERAEGGRVAECDRA